LVFSSIRSSSRSTLEKAFLISNNLLSSGRTRWKHTTVRLIAVEDLPGKKGYKGDVIHVKPGYARNYLVPKKKAVYATPQNFAKFGILDPDLETPEEREARRQQESSLSKKEEQYLKDADLLKKYLKNKVLKIWRAVDPNTTDALHPGMVTSQNLREKLSKQLKIDLEGHETIHIHSGTPIVNTERSENEVQSLIDEFEPEGECGIEIKQLGNYLAKISLAGGYSVPLQFTVVQRLP